MPRQQSCSPRAGSHSGTSLTDVARRLTAALADRYTIARELGAGGMATVYLAHDLKHDRDVAIKVLHPDLGAALGAERFLSEIKTTRRRAAAGRVRVLHAVGRGRRRPLHHGASASNRWGERDDSGCRGELAHGVEGETQTVRSDCHQ